MADVLYQDTKGIAFVPNLDDWKDGISGYDFFLGRDGEVTDRDSFYLIAGF